MTRKPKTRRIYSDEERSAALTAAGEQVRMERGRPIA